MYGSKDIINIQLMTIVIYSYADIFTIFETKLTAEMITNIMW